MRFTKIENLKLIASIDMRIVSTSLDYITKKVQYVFNIS